MWRAYSANFQHHTIRGIGRKSDFKTGVNNATATTERGRCRPKKVPMKNVESGTLMTGETMFMNQFGRNGVMRRNTM